MSAAAAAAGLLLASHPLSQSGVMEIMNLWTEKSFIGIDPLRCLGEGKDFMHQCLPHRRGKQEQKFDHPSISGS